MYLRIDTLMQAIDFLDTANGVMKWLFGELLASGRLKPGSMTTLQTIQKDTHWTEPEVTPRHVCGAQGFGAPGDICPGCIHENRGARHVPREGTSTRRRLERDPSMWHSSPQKRAIARSWRRRLPR